MLYVRGAIGEAGAVAPEGDMTGVEVAAGEVAAEGGTKRVVAAGEVVAEGGQIVVEV